MHPMDAIFRPRSVAVIGASQQRGKIGWELVHNIIRYGFRGKVFPVNPYADFVHSIKSFRSILEIPDPVDLAIITVPRNQVLEVVDQCGEKRVQGLVVISAGFKEVNEEGARLEGILAEKIRNYGMRMIGPNCMGIINTDPAVSLDATFAPEIPARGKIGFISQSGALGVTILSLSRERNVGFSMFASIGNKTNISSNDLLLYWEDDPDTQIVLLYLENFGNPKRFAQIAKRFTRKKPILAVKSGRTVAGARAASSHTGALVNLDVATDAIFDQFGVLRANTIDELFDYATALVSQPLPLNNRVAILTNAGGPGIMATDSCVSLGIDLAEFQPKTIEALRKILPPESNPNNPVDLLAGARPEDYKNALEVLLLDENVGSVLLINVPPIMIDPVEVAASVSAVATRFNKPVLGCFMGVQDILNTIRGTSQSIIPLYAFPESAARALSGMVRYSALRKQSYEEPKQFIVDKTEAEEIIEDARKKGLLRLEPFVLRKLLMAYGIPSAAVAEAGSSEEAVKQAVTIGYPVVMKALMKQTEHKTDFGGVIIDLRNEAEVQAAYKKIEHRVKQSGLLEDWTGVYLQPMIRGKEVILGMSYDPTFGPLLMFGLGGVYVESIKDTIFRIVPITERDALTMIQSIRGYPLLQGVRGEAPVDIQLLAEVLQRLSQLCADFPAIREIEINPFMCSAERNQNMGADARILFDWNLK